MDAHYAFPDIIHNLTVLSMRIFQILSLLARKKSLMQMRIGFITLTVFFSISLNILFLHHPVSSSERSKLSLSYQELLRGRNQGRKYYHLSDLLRLRKAEAPHPVTVVIPGYRQKEQKNIIRGVLVTYHNYRAREVLIAGNFNRWHSEPMHKNIHGVWYAVMPQMKKSSVIQYRLRVDGVWISSPLGERRFAQNLGKEVNVFFLEKGREERAPRTKINKGGLVTFRIYQPSAHRVSIAGDFNAWNMWQDYLTKKENGVWELTIYLGPGNYLYRFYVDDQWKLDLYNPKTRVDENGQIASFLSISSPKER